MNPLNQHYPYPNQYRAPGYLPPNSGPPHPSVPQPLPAQSPYLPSAAGNLHNYHSVTGIPPSLPQNAPSGRPPTHSPSASFRWPSAAPPNVPPNTRLNEYLAQVTGQPSLSHYPAALTSTPLPTGLPDTATSNIHRPNEPSPWASSRISDLYNQSMLPPQHNTQHKPFTQTSSNASSIAASLLNPPPSTLAPSSSNINSSDAIQDLFNRYLAPQAPADPATRVNAMTGSTNLSSFTTQPSSYPGHRATEYALGIPNPAELDTSAGRSPLPSHTGIGSSALSSAYASSLGPSIPIDQASLAGRSPLSGHQNLVPESLKAADHTSIPAHLFPNLNLGDAQKIRLLMQLYDDEARRSQQEQHARLEEMESLLTKSPPGSDPALFQALFPNSSSSTSIPPENIGGTNPLSSSAGSTSTIMPETINVSRAARPPTAASIRGPSRASARPAAPSAQPSTPPALPAASSPAPGPPSASAVTLLRNLKILRRHDPSIQLILDSFNHVCVYEYDQVEKKWDRSGVEGSMFIYERASPRPRSEPEMGRGWDPKYGIYILNRVGGEDFNLRVFPDDDINFAGGIWMVRSFPAYSKARAALAKGLGSAYKRDPRVVKEDKELQGPSKLLGLWIEQAMGSERMNLVLNKLWTSVANGVPYEATDASSTKSVEAQAPQNEAAGGGGEEAQLEALIKKLQQSSATSTPNNQNPMDALFARAVMKQRDGAETPNSSGHNSYTAKAKLGDGPIIHSPQPTTTALPQVLNQEVIDSFLGLRAAPRSVVGSSLGLGRLGGDGSSREGDVDSSSSFSEPPSVSQSETEGSTHERGRKRDVRVNGTGNGRGGGRESNQKEKEKNRKKEKEKEKGDNTPKAPPPTIPPGVSSFFPEDQSSAASNGPQRSGEDDILELDFGDLSKLGEMESGRYSPSKAYAAKSKGKGKAQAAPVVASAPPPETQKAVVQPTPPPPAPPAPNVHVPPAETEEARLRAIIIANSTAAAPREPKIATKREFIMQLLEKIHRDKDFGERLWQDYQSH